MNRYQIAFLLLVSALAGGCRSDATNDANNALLLLLLSVPGANAAQQNGPVYFSTGQGADLVIGQASFTATTANRGVFPPTANTLSFPYGLAVIGTRLFISETGNHRVLAFNNIPTALDTGADFVVGQSSFAGAGTGSTAAAFNGPRGVAAGSSLLAVADQNNRRVQVFNPTPTAGNVSAAVAIGAATTTSQGNQACTASDLNGPGAAFVVGDRVIVADPADNRVLIWNSIPTGSHAAADIVLGQTGKTSCAAGAPSASSLNSPFGVWSDGTRLLVVDRSNSRVLLWNTFPTSDGQAADVALGQTSLTGSTGLTGPSNLSLPVGVFSNGTQIFVADGGNNRVMIWNTFPTTSGVDADVVLGQQNFTTATANTGGVGAATLSVPSNMLLSGTRLLVADSNNHRVLVYTGRRTP
jgi:hypothetical protein